MTADYTLLSPRQIVALTCWAEARGEPIEGQIAVGCVIRNRAMKVGGLAHPLADGAWAEVCLKPKQFSCFNPDSIERPSMLSVARVLSNDGGLLSDGLRQCLWIADGVIGGAVIDVTGGANHYLTRDAYPVTSWAKDAPVKVTIGRHVFLDVA